MHKWRWVVLAAALACVGGCAYVEAKKDVWSGGPQEREKAAQTRLDEEQRRKQNLQDQQLQTEREIERNQKRLVVAQGDLDKANKSLAEALKAKKVSADEYNRLKNESDKLKKEMAVLEQDMQAERAKPASTVDPAKERRLKELEQRKADLERSIRIALGR